MKAPIRKKCYLCSEPPISLRSSVCREHHRLRMAKRRKTYKGLTYDRAYRVKNYKRYLWQSAKDRAKKKGREFSLSIEDITIPTHCPIFGVLLNTSQGEGLKYNSPSIDRIDPSKGYTKTNTQVISHRANHLKNNGSLEEFEKLVEWLRRS